MANCDETEPSIRASPPAGRLGPRPELPERVGNGLHRAVEQRPLALDEQRPVGERRQGGEEPRREPRLARVEAVGGGAEHAALAGQAAVAETPFDGDGRGVEPLDARPERADGVERAARVVAQVEVAQRRAPLGQEGQGQRPLGVALRTGWCGCAPQQRGADGAFHYSSTGLRWIISCVRWWLRLSSKFWPR